MPVSKQDQFSHENKTWKRSLEFLEQENTFLKNRLSVVVDNKEEKEFIVLAEYFQSQFLLKDAFIDTLKKSIIHQQKSIDDKVENDNLNNSILNRQENLRNEINFFEKEFTALKNEFNKSVVQYL